MIIRPLRLSRCILALSFVLLSLSAQTDAPVSPPDFLQVVRRYADTMIDRGRDTYGPQKTGLFLSSLDRMTLAPLTVRPAPPAGIRRGDRAGRPWVEMSGANPHLDQNLLRILYTLSQITGDNRYQNSADAEVAWFLNNTLSPESSLLPWGEHLCWDVILDKPISGGDEAMHEFARPWVLWDRCFALAPEPSRRFALGLWEHQIANQQTGAFDRHAPYFQHGPRDGKDFPRHAGFYIGTWCYAYKHTKQDAFLRAIEALLGRFEQKRVQKDGSRIVTIGPLDCHTAAAMVPEPLAARLLAFADQEDALTFAEWQKQPPLAALPKWQMAYGGQTAGALAMFCLERYQQSQRQQYRDMLIAVADAYLESVPEEDADVWPMTFAHAISVEVAAYRFTLREAYRDQAVKLARIAVEVYWQDNPLPRASFKTGHYETITGADSLALALLEVHAIVQQLSVEIPSNVIDR
ncbi:MAG: hypothetical protein NTU53_22245 [Planctomycetota bacterium]|nr:hypothetical protein [Planctomycetota bacterium]